MSRRRSREDTWAALDAPEGADRLRLLTTREDLVWLAGHQRDVAAREAGTGKALTGMPRYESRTPSLPGRLDGPDLSGDIARALDSLVRELMDAQPAWTPDERETVRWRQAALQVEAVCASEHDTLAWWDVAAGLRRQAERVLGADARGRWLGPCPVPSCDGEVRMGDDQHAAVCEVCGGFVTREQQHEYIRAELDGRLLTLSQLESALVTVGAPVPYRTLQTWVARGRLVEYRDWDLWRGVPFEVPEPTGLYPFSVAFTLAAKRATRVRVGGLAA